MAQPVKRIVQVQSDKSRCFRESSNVEFLPADVQRLPQVGAEKHTSVLPEILPQVGDELFGVPWEHLKLIIDKCKHDKEQAIFYVRETLQNSWSRAVLQN